MNCEGDKDMYETYKEVFLQKETLAKTFDSMMENADALRSLDRKSVV